MPSENPSLVPVTALEGLTPYRVPSHGAPIDLRLDGNEGAVPPVELLESLIERGVDLLRCYPNARDLEAQLAVRFGVPRERVLVTAGGDEALDRACRAMLAPGRALATTEPTFEMIGRYARLAGAEVLATPWMGGPYPVDALTRLGQTPGVTVVAVVSPNNPTGCVASAEDVRRLSNALPNRLLLLDLAYGEFADEDLTPAALALPNVVVVRTFSKAWGLAGLRVGYALGPRQVIEWLRAAGGPYSVAAPSIAVAQTWLDRGEATVETFVDTIRQERTQLTERLRELGAQPTESQANFVLSRFRDAEWMRDGLASLGIGVRHFPQTPVLAGYVRITCPGQSQQLARLKRALEAVLAPTHLFIDAEHPECGRLATASLPIKTTLVRVDALNEHIGGGWFATSTAAGVAAARAHGLVPVGIGAERAAMVTLGAARVVGSLEELRPLLEGIVR